MEMTFWKLQIISAIEIMDLTNATNDVCKYRWKRKKHSDANEMSRRVTAAAQALMDPQYIGNIYKAVGMHSVRPSHYYIDLFSKLLCQAEQWIHVTDSLIWTHTQTP